jgi:hypothetical protein
VGPHPVLSDPGVAPETRRPSSACRILTRPSARPETLGSRG